MTNAKISADALLTQINEIELNENKTVNKKKLILQRMYEEYINELNKGYIFTLTSFHFVVVHNLVSFEAT